MPPRRSISRSRQSLARSGEGTAGTAPTAPAPTPATPVQPAEPVASSSKVTLDMPPPVADSITFDYVSQPRLPQVFTEDDKERLLNEILGFAPFNVLHDISEHARNSIYPTVSGVDEWAHKMAEDDDEMEHEIDVGSVKLETLLESHVDRAFDKFTAYALRNSFKVPDGVELVLPWQANADYDRAKFVTTLPDGEGTLLARLAALRRQVEQARLVQHRLAVAEATLDRKLAIATQRRAQVGFVHDGLVDAGLTPLPDKVGAVVASMNGIQEQIASVEVPTPSGPREDGAWESGRQAYLAWATGRALAQETSLSGVEAEVRAVGTADEVAALGKSVK